MKNKTEIRCFKRWLYLKELDKKNLSHKKNDNIDDSQSEEYNKMSAQVSCTQWTPEEDEVLRDKVRQFGTQNWVIIARFLPGRLGR